MYILIMLFLILFQVSALITGLIFLRQPYNQKGIMNINGAYFIMLIQVSYTNMIAVLNVSIVMLNMKYIWQNLTAC